MSHVRAIVIDGHEAIEVYIGPEWEPFGICYECEDGFCGHCVGIPCECPCPPVLA